MNIRKAGAVVAVAAGLVVGSAGAGQALTWNSSTSPLTVAAHNSVGKGYGTWAVSTGTDGTRSRLSAKLALPTKGATSHRVYAKLSTWVNSGYCGGGDYLSCDYKYYFYNDADTPHTSSSTYVTLTSSTGLPASADYARAAVYVKLEIPLKGDPGAGPTYTQGMKY